MTYCPSFCLFFLVGSSVLVDGTLEGIGSPSSLLSSFCPVSIVDPFSGNLLLPDSRVLISSIKPLPTRGMGLSPDQHLLWMRPSSHSQHSNNWKRAILYQSYFPKLLFEFAAASPVKGQLSSDINPEKIPDAGRRWTGGVGEGGGP